MATFAQTLNRRISIQKRLPGKDAAGQRIETWTELRKDWANIRTTGGLEAIRAGAVTGKVNASIRIRYCKDVDGSMRVALIGSDTVYQIVAPLPDECGRQYLDLLCEAVT